MNIPDENIPDEQRDILRAHHMAVRHFGRDIGRQGIKNQEIIPLLLRLSRPTLFTRGSGFYRRTLRHARYCLVFMSIAEVDSAEFVRDHVKRGDALEVIGYMHEREVPGRKEPRLVEEIYVTAIKLR